MRMEILVFYSSSVLKYCGTASPSSNLLVTLLTSLQRSDLADLQERREEVSKLLASLKWSTKDSRGH